MRDPHAHREILLDHGNALGVQPFKGIPGAVSGRQNGCMRLDQSLVRFHARQDALLCPESQAAGLETDLAAGRQDLCPQTGQDLQKPVRSHMRLCLIQDFRRTACLYKGLQDEGGSAFLIIDQGIELAVRKGSGASLPELDIGGRIQPAAFPEAPDVLLPLFHRPAPLNQQGPVAVPGQQQSTEESGRAGSDDHRPVRYGRFPCFGEAVDDRTAVLYIVILQFGDQAFLPGGTAAQADIHCIYIIQERFLPGVHRMPDDPIGQGFRGPLHFQCL